MESETGTNAVVHSSHISHCILLSFPLPGSLQTHTTSCRAVSTLIGAQSCMVLLILVMMLDYS